MRDWNIVWNNCAFQCFDSINGTMLPALSHQPPVSQSKQSQNNADDAKHRHFVEQQKRLQQFGSRPQGGDKKMDADSLIASIIGKTGPQNSHASQKNSALIAPFTSTTFVPVPSTTSQAASSSGTGKFNLFKSYLSTANTFFSQTESWLCLLYYKLGLHSSECFRSTLYPCIGYL